MPLNEIKQILTKYQKEEGHINQLLQQNQDNSKNKLGNVLERGNKKFLSLEEAVKRNKAILKDLETVKGNLRSKAIYSPSEMQWEAISKNYQMTPSLPVTSWRCHMSVFV